MEALSLGFVLQFLPAVLLALAALAAPELCARLIRRMLDGLRAHLAEWLYILLDSYVRPAVQILRVLLLYLALVMAPFVAQHALLMSALGTLRDLLVTFFIGLGAWRAAPISRLLLSSAQNKLDLQTNQTMARFFENIFRALVAAFTGIALLDRLGVPVAGLLTGAGVAGLAISLQPDRRHHAGIGTPVRHRGLCAAGRLRGHGGGYLLPLDPHPHHRQRGRDH